MHQYNRQLHVNLASAQARHKKDAQQIADSEASLRQSQARVTALEQEIASKDDITDRTEQELKALKMDVRNEHAVVCNFVDHLNILINERHCSIRLFIMIGYILSVAFKYCSIAYLFLLFTQ